MLAPRKRIQSPASNRSLPGAGEQVLIEKDGKTMRRLASKTTSYIALLTLVLLVLLVLLVAALSLLVNNGDSTPSAYFSNKKAGPLVVSVVIPSVVDPSHRHRRVQAIVETWAEGANALIVVHNSSQEYPNAPGASIWDAEKKNQEPSDKTRYPQVLQLPSNITMADTDGFQRLEYVIRHVYYQQQADFIFLVNDHSYVIPSHLCHYLRGKSPQHDLYAGRAMQNPGMIFNSGAAGYLLSRATMTKLLNVWDQGDQCQANQGWLRSNPDLVVAQCLQDVLHVAALDSRESGKFHRFHSYGLVRTVLAAVDEWYINVHDRFKNVTGFDESYRTLLNGTDCCSRETISFHYVEYKETRALYEIRKRLLKDQYMTDSQLLAFVIDIWPKQDLGGYSFHLPADNEQQMKQLLSVLRKMSTGDLETTCW